MNKIVSNPIALINIDSKAVA